MATEHAFMPALSYLRRPPYLGPPFAAPYQRLGHLQVWQFQDATPAPSAKGFAKLEVDPHPRQDDEASARDPPLEEHHDLPNSVDDIDDGKPEDDVALDAAVSSPSGCRADETGHLRNAIAPSVQLERDQSTASLYSEGVPFAVSSALFSLFCLLSPRFVV
ncbi:hypothetical protein Cni_G06851 [Canna indica]|uniref:Uncharacterized protein n=1 Tax=Canna indica TaxID=4628 RepID=A0AAQ3K147_9LILI|nr:hypothetical protein Cni_G06851 [Canna indica]